MLPFDFGTTPAPTRAFPGLNLDTTSPPACRRSSSTGDRAVQLRLGPRRRTRCNCPLDEDEKQCQFGRQPHEDLRQPHVKFGIDIRRAYNLRVPSDRHRSGELTSTRTRTRGPSGGGLGLATFLLGDVTAFHALRQHEHGRARAPVAPLLLRAGHLARHAKLTLNYGLRLDVINPQTRQRGGQRRLARHQHRRDPGRRRRATSTWTATSRTR